MVRSLANEFPDAHAGEPSRAAGEAIEAMVRSLAGENADDALQTVALDLASVPPFAQRVYSEARRIPHGQTRSYGEVARALGKPGGARAVGQALGRNPVPLLVPCHRIIARQGRGAGGFTAPGGLTTKARLLAIEGHPLEWDA